MKKYFLFVSYVLIGCLYTTNGHAQDIDETYGSMYQWRSYMAFTALDEVAVMNGKVYAVSSNSMFAVNKESEEIEYYTKLSGLSTSGIGHIAHNVYLDKILITYLNGQLDIIDNHEDVHNISDLYVKQMNASKQTNAICMHNDVAYMGMSFGVLVVDLLRLQIQDTYYIGYNSTEVNVAGITVSDNHIYAATNDSLYIANLKDNLSDYNFWKTQPLPLASKTLQSLCLHNGTIFIVQDNKLYTWQDNAWKQIVSEYPIRRICKTENHLFLLPENVYGALEIDEQLKIKKAIPYGYIYDIAEDGNTFWLGTQNDGLIKYANQAISAIYQPEGPCSNFSYRLRTVGDKLYMLPGGRWAVQYIRLGEIMMLQSGRWDNITNGEIVEQINNHPIYDVMDVAQDPNDSEHYFVTSFGTGILEMKGHKVVKHYMPNNSPLIAAASNNPSLYTRTDGIMYDDQGNLWILNTGNGTTLYGTIHVVSPTGKWTSFQLYDKQQNPIRLETPGDMFMDQRNPTHKWIAIARNVTGLVLLQDNGTPDNPKDDQVTFRSTWMDQNNNQIAPTYIYSIAQDKNNALWVGTNSGLIVIPASIDFTTSNRCERVIMPRNDGTQLGDYLLDNEQVNAIVVDGANRLWIGTATSGLYLMQFTPSLDDADNTLEMLAHYTTENSLLPTNDVLSIAISESTGEVFVGTGGGLVSYMSDAIEPYEDFGDIYAYPNPVRPNYQGYVTIKGTMESTQVRIIDANGNLIKKIDSTGGAAVWDCTNVNGDRVASGVYTALCNTKNGNEHGSIKILIMN